MTARIPIVLDMDGWATIASAPTPEDLRKYGPIIYVGIQAVGPDRTPGVRIDAIVALLDTGASLSCISPRLAPKFGVSPYKVSRQFAAGNEPEDVPVFRCKLFFPCMIEMESDFAMLKSLNEPTEILIGRDLLHAARLLVDFTTSQWELHFKIP